MSDSKLFSLQGDQAQELTGSTANLARDLQQQIEANMPVFLGVQFLATEYSTGKTHRGRIDSLGLDDNNCPVIVEHKRHKNENIINQGLFYLGWLLDHKAEFQWLVMAQNDGFSRDVSGIGHWATGDVELSVRTPQDAEKAKELISLSYDKS